MYRMWGKLVVYLDQGGQGLTKQSKVIYKGCGKQNSPLAVPPPLHHHHTTTTKKIGPDVCVYQP